MTACRYARGLPGSLLAYAAILAGLAGLAGCTAASSSQTVGGKTLSIYVSAPATVASNATEQDVLYAEELAFCTQFSIRPCKGAQFRGTVGTFTVQLVPRVASKLSNTARDA
ncbi:MAG TPA: hypothetical protein VGY32_08645, partial [Solirubrobacteraceae bacterium]|nr:hypothetical protein [Solirubrobacteraceae bacterium]